MTKPTDAYPIRTLSADETLAFRQEHLWPDMPLDHVRVPGDDTALHLGAYSGDALIGVASFIPQRPRVQLRKLAVAPTYRGLGLGSQLVADGAARMRQENFTELWCDARKTALGFYEALGFTIGEDTFEKSGLMYHTASLKLGSQHR